MRPDKFRKLVRLERSVWQPREIKVNKNVSFRGLVNHIAIARDSKVLQLDETRLSIRPVADEIYCASRVPISESWDATLWLSMLCQNEY